MKHYDHIVSYVTGQPWAILPEKAEIITEILELRLAGITFSQEEIQARIGAEARQNDPTYGNAVAVLPLRGIISHRMGMLSESSGGTSTERFAKLLWQAVDDSSVGTIVIDVDSPGGAVRGVPELGAEILKARKEKPIVAVANAHMDSAAYWIGSAATEVVATPSAEIGSIGVVTMHIDQSKALEDRGVKVSLISAGEHKTDGNPFEPLPEEVRDKWQEELDAIYTDFIKAVAAGRDVAPSRVRQEWADGQIFTAKEAKALGMVDRIATMDETIARLSRQGRRQPRAAAAAAAAAFSHDAGWAATLAELSVKATEKRREREQSAAEIERYRYRLWIA